MGIEGGLALCLALAGADYGSTRYALAKPGIIEVGPVARYSIPLGASVKVLGCSVGEVLLRGPEHKRARVVFRIAGVTLGVVVVAHNLRVAHSVGGVK